MNFLSLRYFLEVANSLSFTKSAEKMFVSQQNLSAHIKRLEDEYSVRLFERKPTLRLTASGERLVEAATAHLKIEDDLKKDLSTFQNNHAEKIRIGLPPNRAPAFIKNVLPSYKQQYPYVHLSFIEGPSQLLEKKLFSNDIDIAVIVFPNEGSFYNPSIFVAEELSTESLYVIISDALLEHCFSDVPACKERFRSGILLEELKNAPMIISPQLSRTHGKISVYLQDRGIHPNIFLDSMQSNTLISLCADDQCVIFCQHMVLYSLFQDPASPIHSLNIFPVKNHETNNVVGIMYRRDKYLSKALNNFIAEIRSAFLRISQWNLP